MRNPFRAPRIACLFTFLFSIPWSASVMSATPQTQISSFHLDAPRSKVFPLFTAEGERGWAPGWNPEMLSGAAERGSAFRTNHSNGQETVWVVTAYDPEQGRVSYARAALGSNIGLVDVVCTDSRSGGTDISVRYTLTALSESGRAFVSHFLSPEHYSQMIEEWRTGTTQALAKLSSER
jgi:hypothetical protein